MADLNALAAALIDARARKDAADAALKDAGAMVEEAETSLFAAMVDSELEKITADGYGFTLDTKEYYSADPETIGSLRMSMVARGLGGIFKYSANYQTLNATLRELASQHGGALPEEVARYVSVYTKPKVLVRKAAKR